jgi:hypothetical protein
MQGHAVRWTSQGDVAFASFRFRSRRFYSVGISDEGVEDELRRGYERNFVMRISIKREVPSMYTSFPLR